MQPFHPIEAATANISATTSSGSVAIARRPTNGPFQLRIHNAGTTTVFVAKGDSTVTAATTDMPVPPGAVEVITIQSPANTQTTHVAAITASGSGTIYFTTGVGI